MRAIAINAVKQVISHFSKDIKTQQTDIENRLQELIDTPLTDNRQLRYARLLKTKAAKIITAEPKDLLKMQAEFDRIIHADDMESDVYETFRKQILTKLRYSHRRSVFYPAYFGRIGIKACVYCNAQSALTITRKKEKDTDETRLQAKFQVDHYLAKKAYPCFSISLFNLYPVCSSCNNVKGTKKIDFSLYVDQPATSNFKFYLEKGSKGKYLNSRDLQDVKICLDSGNKALPADYSDYATLFELEGIYKEYKDVASELILKAEVYTSDYKRTLLNSFQNYMKAENIDRLITGNYTAEEEIHQRPLAKFVRDISIDVGLIEKK
ncbi:hypothetical protein [Mucilaginibacter jinjuensis]|uniref:HNH endonuclease n=1 Tax=Mucilaginibacter jinjuensis TaxID=1176721 RepID=A0ABY7T436_9SPHI|nr:hypothetical protein [Mucilaginibacter jinjuensis]WCT11029.1 hypothetical protein PQO05_20025 [Mucilaginibacter jinjuensis]